MQDDCSKLTHYAPVTNLVGQGMDLQKFKNALFIDNPEMDILSE
ncbi:MAG: hypothetical protein R2806_15100 [Saprospiraceae bacterium]